MLKRMCIVCFQVFKTLDERNWHMRELQHFGKYKFACTYCNTRFISDRKLSKHMMRHMGNYVVATKAYRGRFQVISRTFPLRQIPNVATLRKSEEAKHHNIIDAFVAKYNLATVYCTAQVRFFKIGPDNEITEIIIMPMTTTSRKVLYGSRGTIPSDLNKFYLDLEHRISVAEFRGSGWVLQDILGFSIHIAKITHAGI